MSPQFPPEYELGALANKDFQYLVRTTFGKLKEKDWLNYFEADSQDVLSF